MTSKTRTLRAIGWAFIAIGAAVWFLVVGLLGGGDGDTVSRFDLYVTFFSPLCFAYGITAVAAAELTGRLDKLEGEIASLRGSGGETGPSSD